MSMEALRLEGSRNLLLWIYWAASGYGERILRASIVLLLILLIFALFYTKLGLEKSITNYFESVIYSLNVVALQKPEPKALTIWAKFFVGVETILGPLQAALLALAIRRRFMR